ncbi:MAG: hypothetical protein ACI4JD_01480 [Ruminococcus sp.]
MEETVQRVSGRCDDMRFPCEVRLSVGTGKASEPCICIRFACVKGIELKIRVEPWLFAASG